MDKLKEFYKNKKIFITGHTGFKGAWICNVLLNFKSDICGYALKSEDISLYNILKLDEKIKSIIGDIRDLEKLKKAITAYNPDIVIHMAAQPLVIESYNNPVYTYETNVIGTVNILESLRYCNSVKSFVNVTTDKVYENKEWEWGYRENENLCGYDPYSNSKSCSELVTYSYKNSFFKDESSPAISTARSGNVIGGGDFSANRIIPDCIRAASKNENILVRNPNSTRPYQHVLECLYGYLLLAMKQYEDKKYEGNYNFGPNEENCITTGELTDIFCEIWNKDEDKKITWYTENQKRVHEANFLKLDCSKAKSILNWKPNWNIQKSIEETVKWNRVYIEKQDMNIITDNQISEYFKI